MLESKRAVIEIKNDFGEFISRLAHDVERISELADIGIGTTKK